ELVGRGASHLLDLGGKRLRPLCLSLAARVGMPAIDQRVLDLAVAVELVHSATLLHDDVVDGGDARRGSATSRAIYGNAASIFAGDWLLIEALRRVENSAVSGLLNELFSVIEQMIFAESLQLENRGRLSLDRAAYFQVAEGKTATVFRWAMLAGARAAGVEPATERALATFGEHLGVSFQAVDDLLDLTGDAEVTGKALFTDLVEGKMTLPLILALERAPELRPTLEAIVALPDGADVPPGLVDHVSTTVRASGAAAECLAIARGRSERAVAALADVPDGRARRALVTMAEAIVDRDV
ncbi:MAG: polyprenyl synthetase family protein, partial [Acidobacteriota bacterium]